jgi:predicted HAD superfamily hydrolase
LSCVGRFAPGWCCGKKARHEGSRVAFISDIYLPEWAVRAILVRSGCWKEGDRLYVSCEAMKTKRSGEMFRHVLELESIPASQMTHVGNHPYSDVDVPRRLGIEVEPFLQGNLNAGESDLTTVKGFGPVLPGLLTGCSRLARLRVT